MRRILLVLLLVLIATPAWAVYKSSMTTAGGSGTVTSVSVTTHTGVSGSVATATTTPAISLTLGNITPTTVNGITFTSAATGFTVAGGSTSKTLTMSNTLTFTGTDASSVAFGTGGTVTYTSNNLGVFASTTSAQLAGVLSDETGSGSAVFGTAPTITGGTITGLTGIAAVATGKAGTIPAAPYVSGRFYLGGPLGCTLTAANTTPIVNDTVYASIGFTAAPITIKSLSFRTSSTSANVGASIKIAIYAADGANGTPGTLLGSTAAGTAVADAATTTDIKINLDSPTAVPAGPFFIAVLQTSTTGLRFQELTGSVSYGQVLGTDTNVHLFAGTPINLGYTVAQAYASGMPSPFGTAVLNTTPGLSIAFAYEIN